VTVCTSCGFRNEADAIFCARCNHFLEWEDGPPPPEPEPDPEPAEPEAVEPAQEIVEPEPAEALDPRPEPTPVMDEPVMDEPVPTQPEAVEPTPESEPEPELAVVEPEPVEPEVVEPVVIEPEPAVVEPEPAVVEPEPEPEPTVVEPGPALPEAVEPEPESAAGEAEPEPEAVEPEPSVAEPAAAEGSLPPVTQVLQSIDQSARLAHEQGRPDLVQHLEQARGRLRHGTATVAVVGEFKQGKSTLVNALLQTAVCPVDADIATAVPTVVAHGETVGVTSYLEPAGDGPVRPVEASLNDIRDLVASGPGDGGQRYVEVHLPHRMLRAGLRLIDTPGVGGLDSAYGQLALGALQTADGALFVTDASQELTAPELDFLRSATSRCPTTAVVISKTDLYPEWRRMAELNQGHLRTAGIDVPVLPVSSFLRLRATTDPTLNEEAGFAPLVTFLASVVSAQAGRAAEQAAAEVDFVVEHLAAATQAEKAVLAEPVRSAEVIEDLDRTRQHAAGLSAASASWKVALADGVQDLIADVDHDLQQRLRSVLREAEAVIDVGDPLDTWSDTEVWLRRQVAAAVLQNRELLQSRATDLATDLAADFELAGGAFALRLRGLSDVSETVAMPDTAAISVRPGRLQSIMMVTRTTTFGPMLILGVGGLFSIAMPLIGVAAAAVGAGLGKRALREETERVRSGRRMQAKAAARKYVEEVSFVLSKESRDSLRETQRQLRDDFQARAEVLEASVAAAHRAAQQASSLTPEARATRSRELDAHADRLTRLAGRPGHGGR